MILAEKAYISRVSHRGIEVETARSHPTDLDQGSSRLGKPPYISPAEWEAAEIWDPSMVLDHALSLLPTDDPVNLRRIPTGRIIPRIAAYQRGTVDTFDPDGEVTQKDFGRMGRDVYAMFARFPKARNLARLYEVLEGKPPSFSE